MVRWGVIYGPIIEVIKGILGVLTIAQMASPFRVLGLLGEDKTLNPAGLQDRVVAKEVNSRH